MKPLEDSTNQIKHTLKTHGSAEVEQLRQNVLKLKEQLKALTEEHFRATERVNNFEKDYDEARQQICSLEERLGHSEEENEVLKQEVLAKEDDLKR